VYTYLNVLPLLYSTGTFPPFLKLAACYKVGRVLHPKMDRLWYSNLNQGPVRKCVILLYLFNLIRKMLKNSTQQCSTWRFYMTGRLYCNQGVRTVIKKPPAKLEIFNFYWFEEIVFVIIYYLKVLVEKCLKRTFLSLKGILFFLQGIRLVPLLGTWCIQVVFKDFIFLECFFE